MKDPLMNRLLPFALIALLAACGIDGPPVAPDSDTAPPPGAGLSVTGDAYFGIASGTN